MVIYLITSPSGKQYVGQTTTSVEKRWKDHIRQDVKGSCRALGNAIRKYGAENMRVETLEACESIEELNKRESYWIAELRTLSPNGYNLKTGGLNSLVSEETRERMKKAHLRENLSSETRRKLSEANIKRWESKEAREKHSMTMKKALEGKTFPKREYVAREVSEETRKKMSSSQKRRWESSALREQYSRAAKERTRKNPEKIEVANRARRKKVKCSNGEVYESISEASKLLGIPVPSISMVCNGKRKTAKGYSFAFYNEQ